LLGGEPAGFAAELLSAEGASSSISIPPAYVRWQNAKKNIQGAPSP
jgi:hypothetical protein